MQIEAKKDSLRTHKNLNKNGFVCHSQDKLVNILVQSINLKSVTIEFGESFVSFINTN